MERDFWIHFLTGVARPFVLLLLWVPLMALVLYLVRRFAPKHEWWLFYKVTARGIYQAARRGLRRLG